MMSHGQLVLSILIGCITVGLQVHVHAEKYCWNSTKTGEPRTLPGFATIAEAYMGDFVRLKCCASGFDAINWYRQDSGIWSLIDANDLDDTYNIYEDGQILQIQTALPQDNTMFRCDVTKNGMVAVNGTIHLHVYACRQSGRGPVLTDPFPSNLTIKEFGGDARFDCSASLSCSDDVALVLLRWCINDCNEPVNSRYNISHYTHKDNKYLKTSVLQIHNISPEDLDQRFICQVDSPDIIGGHSAVTIRIFKIPEDIPVWAIGLISFFGVLIVVIVIISISCYCCGPRMRLRINSYCSCFAPKPISRQKYRYNAWLIHANFLHDQNTAISLQKMFKTYGLDVIISGDIQGNRANLQQSVKLHETCALTIVLKSPNLKHDQFLLFFLNSLVEERKGRRIIVIDIGPEPATNNTDPADLNRQQSVPEIDGGGNSLNAQIPDRNGDVNHDVPDECNDEAKIHRLFTGLKPFKIPSENASNRKRKNFECRLVNKIPKFLTDEQKRTNTSRRPLFAVGNSEEERCLMDVTPSSVSPLSTEGSRAQQFNFDSIDLNVQPQDIALVEGDTYVEGDALVEGDAFVEGDTYDMISDGATCNQYHLDVNQGSWYSPTVPVPIMRHLDVTGPCLSNDTSVSGESGYVTSPLISSLSPDQGMFDQQN